MTDPAKVLLAKATAVPPLRTATTQPSVISGGVAYEYNLPVVNRSDKPIFIGEYTFIGQNAPEVAVHVRVKGLETTRAEAPGSRGLNIVISGSFAVGLFVYIVIACGICAFLVDRVMSRIFRKRLLKRLGILESGKTKTKTAQWQLRHRAAMNPPVG